MRRFANDFHEWLRHSWKSLANRHSWKSLANRLTRDTKPVTCEKSLANHLTRDTKSLFTVTQCIILYNISFCHPASAVHSKYWSIKKFCYDVIPFVIITLTCWGQNKIATVLQTTFSKSFSWIKIVLFWLKFHWTLFPRVQLILNQHLFR